MQHWIHTSWKQNVLQNLMKWLLILANSQASQIHSDLLEDRDGEGEGRQGEGENRDRRRFTYADSVYTIRDNGGICKAKKKMELVADQWFFIGNW